jgi:hypothetical protein
MCKQNTTELYRQILRMRSFSLFPFSVIQQESGRRPVLVRGSQLLETLRQNPKRPTRSNTEIHSDERDNKTQKTSQVT